MDNSHKWYGTDEELRNIIQCDTGYCKYNQADLIEEAFNRVSTLDKSLHELFLTWLKTGKIN